MTGNTNQPRIGSAAATGQLSAIETIRTIHDNGEFGVAFMDYEGGNIGSRKPTGRLAFANPFEEDPFLIVTPTFAEKDEVYEVAHRIYPIQEAYRLMSLYALAQATDQMLIVEGPTAIGKTYLMNRFSEMIHGIGNLPLRKVFNTDSVVSEMYANYAPAARWEGDEDDGEKAKFVVRDGVVPVGYGTYSPVEETNFKVGDYPDGCIINLDEIGLAPSGVVTGLLEARGERGSIADYIDIPEIGMRAERGPLTKIFMTTNPVKNYVGRKVIDAAVLRGATYSKFEELSPESLAVVAKLSLRDASELYAESAHGVDLYENGEMADILSETLTAIHRLFEEISKTGTKDDPQRVVATIDDMHRVTTLMQTQQTYSERTLRPDIARTLEFALGSYYTERFGDDDMKQSLKDAIHRVVHETTPGMSFEEMQQMQVNGEVDDDGLVAKASRGERMNQIAGEMYGGSEQGTLEAFESFEISLATLEKLLAAKVLNIDQIQKYIALDAEYKKLKGGDIVEIGTTEQLQASAMQLIEELHIGELNIGQMRQIDRLTVSAQKRVFAPNNRHYLATGAGDEVSLFPDYEQKARIRIPDDADTVSDVDVMGDTVFVVGTGLLANKIHRYDATNGSQLDPIEGFSSEIIELHVDDETGRMIVVDKDQHITLVEHDGQRIVQNLNTNNEYLEKTAISRDGQLISYATSSPRGNRSKDYTIAVSRVENSSVRTRHVKIENCENDLSVLESISPTDFAVGIKDIVHILKYSNKEKKYAIEAIQIPGDENVTAIDVSEDGRYLVVAGTQKVHILDRENNFQLIGSQNMFRNSTIIEDMVVYHSPFGNEIALATNNGLYRFA